MPLCIAFPVPWGDGSLTTIAGIEPSTQSRQNPRVHVCCVPAAPKWTTVVWFAKTSCEIEEG
jgi:hypothetical protein